MKHNPKILKILGKMQEKGVRVDQELLAKRKGQATVRAETLKDKIFAQVGIFNVNSPAQVAGILFDKLQLPPIKKGEQGWSVDDEVLKVLVEGGCEIAKDLRCYRREDSLIESCREIEKNLDEDGISHPEYSLDSITGRVYYCKPAIHKVPKELKELIIPRKGNVFILADYKQIDVRIIAHFSEDRNLIETFRRDGDIYETTMDELGLANRNLAKEICLSICYGRGCLSLSKILEISQVEARKLKDKFFEKYRGVTNFIDDTMNDASTLGYVRTLGEREIEVDPSLSKPEIRKKAIARKIQGSTADLVIGNAMVDVHEAIQPWDSDLVLQVHDELMIEAPIEAERYVKGTVKEKMEHAVQLNVPLKVDIAISKSWG